MTLTSPATTPATPATPATLSARAARQAEVGQARLQHLAPHALLWHSEHRVLINGHKTVIFK